MTLDLDGFLDRHGDELVALRHHLHANPELSWQEHRTTAWVLERLAAAGLAPARLPRTTGLVCDIGDASAPAVALRADLDALPLQDPKQAAYRSTVPGVCHACGHDVHTAVLVGVALALAAAPPGTLRGRVRCIFQPAEEQVPGGALAVIEAGALEGAGMIFGLHCDPKLEVGRIGVKTGPLTGAADMLEVRLQGPGGHTARPQLTVDLVYAAARIVTDVPAGLTRLADPRWGMSVVFGSVQAGTAGNVVPTDAVVRGTLRVLDRTAWEQAPKLIERLVEAAAGPFGATWELNHQRGAPPIVNAPGPTRLLRRAVERSLGPAAVAEAVQSLGSEDFSWYLEQVPGSFARLGVRIPGTDLDLHAARFDADDRAVAVGVRALTELAVEAAAELAGEASGRPEQALP